MCPARGSGFMMFRICAAQQAPSFRLERRAQALRLLRLAVANPLATLLADQAVQRDSWHSSESVTLSRQRRSSLHAFD